MSEQNSTGEDASEVQKPQIPEAGADVTGAGDASEASSAPEEPIIDTREEPLPRPRRRGTGLSTLISLAALVLSLLALVGAYYLWSQTQASSASVAELDAEAAAALEQTQATIRSLEARVEELAGNTNASGQRILELDDRLQDVPGELAAIARRIDAVQGGTFDSRARWLYAEAEYYLGLANTELMLARRWENAIAALDLADDRLRVLADPGLVTVRELIAGESLSLRSVRLPDSAGLAFGLSRLADRVVDLPLRAGLPSAYGVSQPDEEAEEPGLTRLWNSAREAFSSLIRVERTDEPVAATLTAAERVLVQRQLSVELQLARIAVLAREPADFLASIESAQGMLQRDFDTSASEVQGAIALLDELSDVEIAPTPPDISGSLIALRNLSPGDN